MISLKVYTQRNSIVDELGPRQASWRFALLYPSNHGSEDIMLSIERYPDRRRCACLAKNPRAGAGITMEHARDTEEAVPIVDFGIREGHLIIEALSVETRDLVVLTAVVAEELASFCLERGERLRVRSDVERVGLVAESRIRRGVGGRVPSWVVQNDISIPILYSSADASTKKNKIHTCE